MFGWSRSKKTESQKIVFKLASGKPYSLKAGDMDLCSGQINGIPACTFENVELEGEILKIGHFALHGSFIGKGKAEHFLRSFAAHISKQSKKIKKIEFQLKKSTEETMSCEESLIKLANAREALLIEIGTENVSKDRLSRVAWQVSGSWPKTKWRDS